MMTVPTRDRRLYRAPYGQLLAGVAAGLAAHLEIPVVLVRIGFVVLTPLSGLGAVMYAAFWAVLPVAPDRPPGRRHLVRLAPFAALTAGILLLLMVSGQGLDSVVGWLVALVALGAGIIWHQAEPRRRIAAAPAASWWGTLPGALQGALPGALTGALQGVLLGRNRPGSLLRYFGGGALVLAGVIGVAVVVSPIAHASFSTLFASVLLTVVGLVALGLVLAPLLVRTFSQLRAEREARIRERERAELAAMVHDQVLHTLALIQRSAADGKAVLRLARGQERTLRGWLYKPTASPDDRFAAALEEAAAEVEDEYGIAVETVVVGDRAVDDRVRALVAAAREALVNAARHAEVVSVSLYAEVEPEQVSVFVRDRGVGFDPSAMQDDRHGVRGSIIGRMGRHAGTAEIRSQPGGGTEVRLVLPTPVSGATARKAESDG